jgi:hypothetical protein
MLLCERRPLAAGAGCMGSPVSSSVGCGLPKNWSLMLFMVGKSNPQVGVGVVRWICHSWCSAVGLG